MSVMLRCQCGNEVTVPEQAIAGLVACPVCHGMIDPTLAIVHPNLDDLDPDLLLAPDDDFQPPTHAVTPPAAAPVAASDDLLGLVDVEPHAAADDLTFLSDSGSSADELPLDLDFSSDSTATEASEVPDLLSDSPGSSLSAPTPTIQPPDDDDEGYAVVEETYGKSSEAPAWMNPATEQTPEDDLDEILIADDSSKPTKPDGKGKSVAPPSDESLAEIESSMAPSPVHYSFDDLLDDEINIAPEEKPAVPETPPACPECKAELKPGTLLCITCGYNLKTGQKMQAAPELKGKGGKAKPAKAKSPSGGDGAAWKAKFKDPRVMIAVGGGGAVLLLAIVGWLFFGGEEPPPVATPTPTPTNPGSATSTPATPGAVTPDGVATTPAPVDPSRATLVSIPTGVNGKAASFDFSADGKLLAIGDETGSATIWDSEKSEAKPPLAMGVSGPVQVSFDADAKQLLTGFSGGAKLWDIAAGTAREFKSPVDGLFAAQFAPDGKSFFTSGPTGIFSTVDLAAGGRAKTAKLPLPPGFVPVVDITPDGKFGIVGGDEGLLMVWDLVAGRPVAQLDGHTARVAAVAISPDGKRAISAAGGPEYRTVGNERYLMSSRPTDVNVRVWDATTGKELWRLHTPPEKPVTCLAISPDGKLAAIVAGDVQVIDLDEKEQLALIVPAKQGVAQEPGALPLPTDPFRLAAFFPDGERLITAGQNSGLHVWALPEKPERKPLPGVSEPADLASFKPASWEPISPLLIPATAAPDDNAMAERLATASKAADQTAAKIPLIGKLREVLASKPRTAELLIKFSKSCRGKELYLEAEECLRAALMADPTNQEARQEYDDLKLLGPKGTGPVSLTRAWAKEVLDLDDAGMRPDPPRKSYIVSIPIEVAVVDKVTKLDGSTLVGKAGEEEAPFLGIHHRATGEVSGARKPPGGGAPPTGQLQVWEAMAVGKDKKSGKTIVQFANRKMPVQEQPRPGAPAGTPKVKMVADTTKVKEDYKGPYEALFAVPEGETLSEIRWEETRPVRVLGEEPDSLDELALDDSADLSQRLAAIEALGVSPTDKTADTLTELLAGGDDKLFDAVRAALRGVRRRANLIAPEYLPTPDAAEARLMSISFGKIDGAAIAQSQPTAFALPAAVEQPLSIHSSYSYCKTLWNIDKPGKYLARVAVFDSPPTFQKQQTLEFEFTAAEPNLYVVQSKIDRDAVGEVQLIELWRDNKLVERRILSASPWAASSLAARLPLEPPIEPEEDDNASAQPQDFSGPDPSSGAAPAMIANLFPGTVTPAYAAPLLGSPPKLLPPVERAAMEALLTSLPADARPKIPAALVEVARLDIGNGPLTKAANDWLKQLPGDAATGLFIRLAETASPPTAIAAINALHGVGEQSAAACRTLIDLQEGPTDVQKAAEDAVNDLMTQGIIAHEGENWRYHGETHFPEEPKAETKPTDIETAG